ncbi:hypothetical protein V8G54_020832 [Vigna mungo]|uniref:Protein kinase domain-containing protein n=1 Tax=Vigna mungo TaxID=3915 RepID=A0AAQ3RX49_VIGMU
MNFNLEYYLTSLLFSFQNFLYTKKDESSELKAIDFGLSDFVRPDEKLNDIVGSAYYVAPEVLHRSYSTEADVWILKADPSFDETPGPSLSSEAKDFVKRLLNKDPRKRISAAQALTHEDIYEISSFLRKAALRALSKTLTADELYYLREQFSLLEPSKNRSISLENVNKVSHHTMCMKFIYVRFHKLFLIHTFWAGLGEICNICHERFSHLASLTFFPWAIVIEELASVRSEKNTSLLGY